MARSWRGVVGHVMALTVTFSCAACSSGGSNGSDDATDGTSDAGSDDGFGGTTPEVDASGAGGAGGGTPQTGGNGPDAAIPPPDGGTNDNPDSSVQPQPDASTVEPDAAVVEEMDAAPQDPPPADGWGVPVGPEVSFGGCNARMQAYTTEGAVHVELCSAINYKSMPPHSGNHYPAWAAYRTYSRTIPWGFLVHSLEHGAMVITYNCPQGCADELAQIRAFIDELPADCGGGVKRRVIVMPEPKLQVKFAASAWRHTLKADCFDKAAFRRFYDERYNKGREDSCNQGTDPTGESSGRPPMCGL